MLESHLTTLKGELSNLFLRIKKKKRKEKKKKEGGKKKRKKGKREGGREIRL